MNCREFQEKHCAFIDDTLPGVDLVRMQEHICECRCCAEHDSRVRKSLLLFRSLPAIEPSCNFADKLQSRLKSQCMMSYEGYQQPFFQAHKGIVTIAGAMVAGAAIIAYIAISHGELNKPQDLIFPPVIASFPTSQP